MKQKLSCCNPVDSRNVMMVCFGKQAKIVLKKYDVDGFDQDGFNGNGFDRQGYDRDRFNKEGFNRNRKMIDNEEKFRQAI